MESLIGWIGNYSSILVPLCAVWAVACLYSLEAGRTCRVTEGLFFVALLLVAGCTVRTVLINDGCWLVNTASLGCLVVAGVMRRPEDSAYYPLVQTEDAWLD
ncbi:MAG: hypothetical protein NXI32_25845 [bacterium]|nr:hypothetical protein [bacterium]